MKLSLRVLSLGLMAITCFNYTQASDSADKSYSFPESALHYDDQIFVSNVGEKLEPDKLDGDGYISLLSKTGELISQKHFDVVLNAPKGMAIYGDTLYVTDINRVVGIDLGSRQQVNEFSFIDLQVSFLNDIVATDDGMLFVSATDTGDIYQINTRISDPQRARSRLPIMLLPGPNGLAYDKSSHCLWVASFGVEGRANGELGKVDLKSHRYEKLPKVLGMLDGLALISDRKAILSDWVAFDNSGKVMEVDLLTGDQTVLFEQLGGPADFSYLAARKELVIPRMIESKVSIKTLKH